MILAEIQACILIPTYNNEKTLQRVISGVLDYAKGVDVIVINDGSTDTTSQILATFEGKIRVITYPINQGKGYALRQGFIEAIGLGYTYAISIDSDGQHLPSDIPVFVDAVRKQPGALIMGSRNMEQEGVPRRVPSVISFPIFGFNLKLVLHYRIHKLGFDYTH
jgi:glycosyltransferase involved in cell wall biosynthesis